MQHKIGFMLDMIAWSSLLYHGSSFLNNIFENFKHFALFNKRASPRYQLIDYSFNASKSNALWSLENLHCFSSLTRLVRSNSFFNKLIITFWILRNFFMPFLGWWWGVSCCRLLLSFLRLWRCCRWKWHFHVYCAQVVLSNWERQR